MGDPTECKVAYLAVVSHPAGETVAHLIDKFLQRRFAQRLWFAWFRSRLHFGYVVAKLASQQGISAARVQRRPGSTALKRERPRPSPGMGIERPAHSAGLLATCGSAPKRCRRTRATNVGYTHRREKRYDSTTAAAAADTGIRQATPQRMRHPPRRPPGARHHHRDRDLPGRIRPAGKDFQLTMAARTRRLIMLCDGGGLA